MTPKGKPRTVKEALLAAGVPPPPTAGRDAKRKYSESLSKHLGIAIADGLRARSSRLKTVQPDPRTGGKEARIMTSTGSSKSIDVALATVEGGLELVVSLKTVTHPDAESGRYGKNLSGRDYELQAEAVQLHGRYPFAVLVGVHFMPSDAASDGKRHSTFAAAVNRYYKRAGRDRPTDADALFERFFVALYDTETGDALFWDVAEEPPPEATSFNAPPRNRLPVDGEGALTWDAFLERVVEVWDYRGGRKLIFRDDAAETVDPEDEADLGDEVESD